MELGAGRVAVVTGAGSGIGLALSHAFATEGCSVVLADVQVDALEHAATEVAGHGVDTLAVRTDVSSKDSIDELVQSALDRFGGVHIVCNNAGVSGAGDPWLGPIEGWEWTMGVNFWGVVYGIRAFLPHLIASGGGHVVNTASMAGLYPGFAPPYDASKHAVVAISESLYNSMRATMMPVGVSCLCPGWVRTGILDADRNWPAQLGDLPETTAASEVARSYARRAVAEGTQPAVVADMVVDAVRDDRFWVIPHDDFLELAMERFHSIGEKRNPQPPEESPGMPPRAQMMAEMMEAMLADAAAAEDG